MNVIGNGYLEVVVKIVCLVDIIVLMSYFLNLMEGIGNVDDIDYLGNCCICLVGEFL